MKLAFIYGPMEIVMHILLVFIVTSCVIMLIAFILLKIGEKKMVNNGIIVYPENLFEEVEVMKKENTLRLYSKRIEKNMFVVTSSEISLEYKDGKFISYSSATPVSIKAEKITFKEFLNKLPEVNYRSMDTKIGHQKRIEYKPWNGGILWQA